MFSLPLPSSLLKLPTVVIQKFCYHGNGIGLLLMTVTDNNQSLIPSADMIQLTLTLKMAIAQVVEISVTVVNNSPIQDYVHPGQSYSAYL